MDAVELMQIVAFSVLFGYVLATMSGAMPENLQPPRTWKNSGSTKIIKPGHLVLLLVVVGSVTFARDVIVGCTPFGTTTIDGVLERGEYTETYYIFAFPDDSEVLNYRVKAQIHSFTQREGVERIRRYEVEKFELPDGINAVFSSLKGTGYSLEPDRRISLKDDNGRRWGIMLTRDKSVQ